MAEEGGAAPAAVAAVAQNDQDIRRNFNFPLVVVREERDPRLVYNMLLCRTIDSVLDR